MKYAYYILMALATVSLVFSVMNLNYSDILAGNSKFALICILVALCVLVLSAIMLISYRIKEQYDRR